MQSQLETGARLLRTMEAARFLGLSPSTLEKLRCLGGGPRFTKLGARAVGYFPEDLLSWAKSRTRRSTSDPGEGAGVMTETSRGDQEKSRPAVLGINIGVQGAIAVITADGELVTVEDMPVLHDGPAGRRTVNAPLLASIVFATHATRAFVEHVSARPGEGPTGAFAFGRSPWEHRRRVGRVRGSLQVPDARRMEARSWLAAWTR